MNAWGEFMLLWSIQVLPVTAALVLAGAALRRNPASDRYRLWLVGLVAITALPFANLVIAALPIQSAQTPPVHYVTQLPVDPASVPEIPSLTQSALSAIAEAPPVASSPPFWIVGLFGFWVVGSLVSIARPVACYLKSRRLRAKATLSVAPASRLPIGLCAEVDAPMLAGILHPMILLPNDIADWADEDEQRAMIQHETAHFLRNDHVANLLLMLPGALLFFHPAVRYALRQLLAERELACDELVLEAGVRPAAYGEALLKTAQRLISVRAGYEPAFHASAKILERRITMILNYRTAKRGSRILSTAGAAVVIGLALLVLPDRAVSLEQLPLPVLVAGVPALTPTPTTVLAAPVIASPALPPTTPQQPQPQAPPQAPPARVSGTVYDLTGAVIPGVTVRVANAAGAVQTIAVQTVITNEAGAYAFPQVSQGQYTLSASLPGFQTYSTTLSVGNANIVADAVLQMAAVSTQVEVSVSAPANPAAATPPSRAPVRVGGDVSAANLISAVKPTYPAAAHERGVQGSVQLTGIVGRDGSVISVYPSRGANSLLLLSAAMDAVKQWKYRPALLNGQPVEFAVNITINFSIQ